MSSFDKLFRPAGPLGGQQLSARQLREIAADAGAAQANDIPGGGFTRTQSGTVYDVPEAAATTFSGARVYNTVNQNLVASALTDIIFDSERYDVGNYANLATSSTLLTPSDTAGYYHVGCRVKIYPSAGQFTSAHAVLFNSTAPFNAIAECGLFFSASSGYVAHLQCCGDWSYPNGGSFLVRVHVEGANGIIYGSAEDAEFWVHKIG